MTASEPPVEVRRARPTRSGRARHRIPAISATMTGCGIVALATALPESRVPTAFAPSWWPTAVGIAVIALGALLVSRRRVDRPEESPAPGSVRAPLLLVMCAVVATALWAIIGFVPSMVALGATSLVVLGARRPLIVALLPLVVSLSLYAFFGLLLRVPL